MRKKYLIYPDNTPKVIWELFVNLLLLVISILTPAQLAFSKSLEHTGTVNTVIDIVFFIDVFVVFFSATENNFHEVCDDRKKIAINYLKGWFTIDVLSIVPFSLLSPQDSGR